MRFVKSTRAFLILTVLAGGSGPAHADAGGGVFAGHAGLWLLAAAISGGACFLYPRLHAAVAGRLRARAQAAKQATFTDSLTGMQNRRYFDAALKEYLVQFDRIHRPVGLMVIDLDSFATINEAHGRDAGDRVLRDVACCLRSFTRRHDVVARLEGAKFAVLAPNMDDGRMMKFARRIRETVAALEIDLGGTALGVTVSIGVTVWDNHETSGDFYGRAAGLLEAAKRSGRSAILSEPARHLK